MMGDYNSLEKIAAREIFRWERRISYHCGSWLLVLPKPLVKASGIKSNQKIAIVFGQILDEKSGRLLLTFDITPINETELKK